jgi:hypothetical protein
MSNSSLHVIRDADSEAFQVENFPPPTFMIPNSAPTQRPILHLKSGSIPEHSPHESTIYACHDSDDYRYGWEVSASTHGCDEHAPGYPLSLALSPSHSFHGQRGTLDQPLSRFMGYGTIYTDDARMKLGDGIRRQCFNCRATETKTWRRSKLSLGKMVRLV